MTDREMLELAAKAAGIKGRSTSLGFITMEAGYDADPLYWNPLTNDGAALRLAVKLGCQLVINPEIGITDCKIGDGEWCVGGQCRRAGRDADQQPLFRRHTPRHSQSRR